MCRTTMNRIQLRTKAWKELDLESQYSNLIPDSLQNVSHFKYCSFKCLHFYTNTVAQSTKPLAQSFPFEVSLIVHDKV